MEHSNINEIQSVYLYFVLLFYLYIFYKIEISPKIVTD